MQRGQVIHVFSALNSLLGREIKRWLYGLQRKIIYNATHFRHTQNMTQKPKFLSFFKIDYIYINEPSHRFYSAMSSDASEHSWSSSSEDSRQIHSDNEKLISSKKISESEHEEDSPSKKRKFSSQSKRKGSKSSKRQKDFSESDSEEVSSSKSQKFFSESENEDDTSDNNQKKLNKLLIEKKLHEKRKSEGETTSSKIKEDRDKAVIIRCSDLKKKTTVLENDGKS